MNRRQLLALAPLLLPATGLWARGLTPTADGKLTMLRGNVGYYTNRGGTVGVYLPGGRPEGGAIVDTQFPEQAADLLARLRDLGELTRFGILANTHHHGDHTGGNAVFAGLADTYVSHERAQENLRANLAEKKDGLDLPLPTTTFADGWSTNLPDGKESVSLRHFGAAHTGGDAVVHFENANVAHLGDLLFNRRFPYSDPGAGGDILNWPAVLKKITAMPTNEQHTKKRKETASNSFWQFSIKPIPLIRHFKVPQKN